MARPEVAVDFGALHSHDDDAKEELPPATTTREAELAAGSAPNSAGPTPQPGTPVDEAILAASHAPLSRGEGSGRKMHSKAVDRLSGRRRNESTGDKTPSTVTGNSGRSLTSSVQHAAEVAKVAKARVAATMSPIDFVAHRGVLLRAVGAGGTDVEAVYVGKQPIKVAKPYHLQHYYGHEARVVAVKHVGLRHVISASNSAVICHDFTSGESRWSYMMTALTLMELVGDMVIIAGVKLGRYAAFVERRRTDIMALDVQTGKLRWTSQLQHVALAIKVAHKKKLLVAGLEHGLVEGRHLETGEVLWTAVVSPQKQSITCVAVDASLKLLYATAKGSSKVTCIDISRPATPKRKWQFQIPPAKWRDGDAIARMFVTSSGESRGIVVATAFGLAFRLHSAHGGLQGSQLTKCDPSLCDMASKHFTSYNDRDHAVSLWEVQMQDTPPVWRVATYNSLPTVAALRVFPASHGDLLFLAAETGVTLIIDPAVGATARYVPIFSERDPLQFVFPMLPTGNRGCDCGCGATSSGTGHAEFDQTPALSQTAGGRQPSSIKSDVAIVGITESGAISLYQPNAKTRAKAQKRIAVAPPVECVSMYLDESSGSSHSDVRSLITGHMGVVIRWDLDLSGRSAEVWRVEVDGLVESLSVCEDEDIVVAVITQERDELDEASADVQRAIEEAKDVPPDVIQGLNVETGDAVWSVVPQEGDAEFHNITCTNVCSASGRMVAGSAAGAVRFFETKTGDLLWAEFLSHSRVRCVLQASSFGLLLAGDDMGQIGAFATPNGELKWHGSGPDANPVLSLGVSQPACTVVSLSMDNETRGWNLQDGALLWVHSGVDPGEPVRELVVTPASVLIRTFHTISCCDIKDGRQLWLHDPPFGEIVAMTPDGGSAFSPKWMAVGSGDGRIEAVNVTSRLQWWHVEETHTVASAEPPTTLDTLLDGYGSRTDFVITSLLLTLQSFQILGMAYSLSLGAAEQSLKDIQSVLWDITTLGTWRLQFLPGFLVAVGITLLVVTITCTISRVEQKVFVTRNKPSNHALWLVMIIILKIICSVGTLPTLLLLAKNFSCTGGMLTADASISCSSTEHVLFFVAAILLMLLFVTFTAWQINVPSRIDRPATEHRRTSLQTLAQELPAGEFEHALSYKSTMYAVTLLLGQCTTAIAFAVHHGSNDSSWPRVGAAIAMAVVWLGVLAMSIRLVPLFSHWGQILRCSLDAGLATAFLMSLTWQILRLAEADGDETLTTLFAGPIALVVALVVFVITAFVMVVPKPNCSPLKKNSVWVTQGYSIPVQKVRRYSGYSGKNERLTQKERVARAQGKDNVEKSDAWLARGVIVHAATSAQQPAISDNDDDELQEHQSQVPGMMPRVPHHPGAYHVSMYNSMHPGSVPGTAVGGMHPGSVVGGMPGSVVGGIPGSVVGGMPGGMHPAMMMMGTPLGYVGPQSHPGVAVRPAAPVY